MGKAGKQPGIAAAPKGIKTPRAEFEPDVVKNEALTWALARVDFEGKWGWAKLLADEAEPLHKELSVYEGQTLHTLVKGQKIKDIPAANMCREARDRLVLLGLEEYDTLWELRLNGKRRVWGVIHGSTYYLLWWDPKETACNPPPKGKRRRRSSP
jgi:hypothetical protein